MNENIFKLSKHKEKTKSYNEILLFMIGGIVILILYGLFNIFQKSQIVTGFSLLISAFAITVNAMYLKVSKNEIKSTLISLFILMLFYAFVLVFGGTNKQTLMWTIIIPLIAFYTQGKNKGFIFSLIFAVYIATIALLDYLSVLNTPFSPGGFLELLLLFFIVSIMTFIYEDATEMKEQEIYKHVYRNILTGLPNRKKLLEDIDSSNKKYLYLINVDDFKEINDLYGADVGDKVICEIAQRLTDILATYEFSRIYKLHADEFALLIPKTQCDSNCSKLSSEIIDIFLDNFLIDTCNIAITATIGISDSERDILADTDIALKTAKDKKIPYAVFEKSMNTSKVYQKNHDDLNRLKKGISQNSITPFFQPIITNSNGAIEKYECLVRLLDNNKVISPFNFLELSKRSKLYPQITKCVIDKSFSHFDKRNEEFSINICLDDILNPETTNYIFDKIDQYNNGNRIVFELLESEQFEDRKEVLEFINQVKKRGCKIAIDDFGTGYSNFDYILRIQADYLKIDASLIKKINTDINSQIITETIVNFSQKLNIKTIAEFVHNEDVYRKVKMMGIDYSQGFHLGEPSPVT